MQSSQTAGNIIDPAVDAAPGRPGDVSTASRKTGNRGEPRSCQSAPPKDRSVRAKLASGTSEKPEAKEDSGRPGDSLWRSRRVNRPRRLGGFIIWRRRTQMRGDPQTGLRRYRTNAVRGDPETFRRRRRRAHPSNRREGTSPAKPEGAGSGETRRLRRKRSGKREGRGDSAGHRQRR